MKENSLDEQYLKLVNKIIDKGVEKEDRTETGTLSIFGTQIRHNMSEGFPLLTSKQMSIKSIAAELNWFLSGSTDIKDLWRMNCHIWNGDAYKRYEQEYMKENPVFSGPYPHMLTMEEFISKVKANDTPFAAVHSDLGPIYSRQWRNFNGQNFDQIVNLIKDIKGNPDSRRLVVSAWNPVEMKKMILPPCHYGFQCYTRKLSLEERFKIYTEKHPDWTYIKKHEFFDTHKIPVRELSLMWNSRSVDTLLGLPYNITSYGLLLLLLCKETNCVPGELIGNLGDTHIYKDQLTFIQKQLDNPTFELPKINLNDATIFGDWESFKSIKLEDYKHAGKVHYPLSN